MGLQGEGLSRRVQRQCISYIDEDLVSVMVQLLCERSLMQNLSGSPGFIELRGLS